MQSFLVLFCLLVPSVALPSERFHSRFLDGASDLALTRKASNGLALNSFNTTELVFGGQFAEPGQLPMQAVLVYTRSTGGIYRCGGTIISPNHILTAAHCTVHLIAPSRIMVGGVNMYVNTSNTQWRDVKQVHVHPDFNADDEMFHHDIAVLEFETPVSYNPDVQPATFVSKDNSLFKNCSHGTVSGFGTFTFRNGNQSINSRKLRYAEVTIVSMSACRDARPHMYVTEMQFCAGAAGRGVGFSDSGGPITVVQNNITYQIGIASYAAGDPDIMENDQDQQPSVFTRISYYCDFIASVTNDATNVRQFDLHPHLAAVLVPLFLKNGASGRPSHLESLPSLLPCSKPKRHSESLIRNVKETENGSRASSLEVERRMHQYITATGLSNGIYPPHGVKTVLSNGGLIHHNGNQSPPLHKGESPSLDPAQQAQLLLLQRIYQELKSITKRMVEAEREGDQSNNWKFAAMVVDRLCLYVFTVFIVASVLGILLSAPYIIA